MNSLVDKRERKQVVLIDDDPDFQAIVREWLTPEFDTVSFPDGGAFLDAVEEIIPDLVIMDIGLPGPDGISLCRRLRSDPRFDEVPILFLTGYGSARVFHDCFVAGGTELLDKPVGPRKLLGAVRRLANREPAFR